MSLGLITRQYFDRNGVKHCFIFAVFGGIFLIISGLFFDPNLGRALTGAMIALRGLVSETSRRYLISKSFSEPVSAFPGMCFAVLMNLPAFLNASTVYEAFAFGLAFLAMLLKFLQYLPDSLKAASSHFKLSSPMIKQGINFLCYLNEKFLNQITKHSVFAVIIAIAIYSVDIISRGDTAGACACICLFYSGIALAIKTRIELSAAH